MLLSFTTVAQPRLAGDNIDEVLGAMTLEEKANLLVGLGWGALESGSATASMESVVMGSAGATRSIARLGIPSVILADGPAGLRIDPRREGTSKTYFCTGFPIGTSLASSWNTDLVTLLTTAMGEEVKEYGVDVLLAPGLNLHRNPLCGRNFEYYSEDPFLTGKMAAAYVRGIQSNGVGTSIKHFAANNQEINRLENRSIVRPRPLREMYLRGFEIAVKEGSPWTVMSSYNKINGTYTQQSHDLLTKILREEWGFRGIVMTDWGGKEGTVKAVIAGNDLMEPGENIEVQRIIQGVYDGTLPLADVDRNVRRMLEFIVRTPTFQGYRHSDSPDLAGHAKLVRKAAPEGMVLLENNGVLPLENVHKVALYGVGSYDFIAGGTGSGNVNKAYVRNLVDGFIDNGADVDAGLCEWYRKYIDYKRSELKNDTSRPDILLGEGVIPEMEISPAILSQKASQSDIAVFTLSRNAGEGNDRKAVEGDWALTRTERDLIQNLADSYHAQGKKLVVVINTGGVIETASWKHIPDAILLAWAPGQEGGLSVADVLCGKAYPSGKLPMTFPNGYFDIPSSSNFPYNHTGPIHSGPSEIKNVGYTDYQEGIWVGYRYFNTTGNAVSYPFGYGLSYTSFEYSKPVVKTSRDGAVTVSVTVTNTGKRAGKEAVQVYVSAPEGGLSKPACELKAFAKTRELAPGESQTLSMNIEPYMLASFNESTSAWVTAEGRYEVLFGSSVEDIRQKAAFKIDKAKSWPVHALTDLGL